MTSSNDRPEATPGPADHPWRHIDLDVYEAHMGDARVGQLSQLHSITHQQLQSYPSRSVGVLGVAGGNGLDLIDPAQVDTVYGYDINPNYLAACEARYRPSLGDRLHLIEATIDGSLAIEPVGLLIANLIVEYVGVVEFSRFAGANTEVIGVLSCVTQRNDTVSFVSSTKHSSSFSGLSSISADVDPEHLTSALVSAGFIVIGRSDHPLPNGKTLVRQDFRPTS